MIAGMVISNVKGFNAIRRPCKTSEGVCLSNWVSYSRSNIFRTGKSLTICQMIFGLIQRIKTIIFHQKYCFINACLVDLKSNRDETPKIKNTASYLVKNANAEPKVNNHKYFGSRLLTYLVRKKKFSTQKN